MPLTEAQRLILELLAENRSEESHLAGAAAIHMADRSTRRSADLDLFHDREQAVADAFEKDRLALDAGGFGLRVELSQPGFIRAMVTAPGHEPLRVDWAHDSMWRFLPPVKLKGAGHVLHPVDLAANKVLALAGRDEPRDFVDVLYLHRRVLPLGALCWAACGKDQGLNPEMLLDLLSRKGRLNQGDLDRLDLASPFDLSTEVPAYREALALGREWIETRQMEEIGCLYHRPGSGAFFAPAAGDDYEIHRGSPGGVLPVIDELKSFYDHPGERERLESFFERPVGS